MLSPQSHFLRRAQADLDALVAEGAPADVIGAARGAISCVQFGLQPPSHLHAVLQRHAAIRSAQNRYGKLLGSDEQGLPDDRNRPRQSAGYA